MNKKQKSTLITLAMLAAPLCFTQQAQAGDEGWAAFGGFVGGTLVANYNNHSRHSSRSNHGGSHYQSRSTHNHHSSHQPSGHYEYESRRVWVEGHYDYERDRCGHLVKVWHPGYYKYEKVKVWVSHGHSNHH